MHIKIAEIISLGSFILGGLAYMKVKKKYVAWLLWGVCFIALIVTFTSSDSGNRESHNITTITTGNNSPAVNISATTSGSNSPVLNVNGPNSGNAQVINNTYNGPVFNGAFSGIILQMFSTPFQRPQNRLIATESEIKDWENLANQVHLAAVDIGNQKFPEAFEHATNAIRIIESKTELTNLLSKHEIAAPYALASVGLDAMESDPNRSYELAQKAFDVDPSDMTKMMLGITSHNLAVRYSQERDFSHALELDRKAIARYEGDMDAFPDKYLMPGAVTSFYRHAARDAGMLGRFEEADKYLDIAYRRNPSDLINFQVAYTLLMQEGKTNEAQQTLMAYAYIQAMRTNVVPATNQTR